MANAQHLALLRRGPRAWNEWRMDDPLDPHARPDLREADLTDAVLADPTLVDEEDDPTGVCLDDADLRSTGFGRADLRDADLRGADLRYTTMIDTVLVGADLRGHSSVVDALSWCRP